MMHKAWSSLGEVSYCFSRTSVKFKGHTGQKIANSDPNGAFPDCKFSLIYRWLWNDAQSLRRYRRSALLFSKIVHQISRSQGTKKSQNLTLIGRFRTVTPVWIHRWLWNEAQSLTWYRREVLLFFTVIHQISTSQWTKISRSHGLQNWQFESDLSKIIELVAAIKSLRFALVGLEIHRSRGFLRRGPIIRTFNAFFMLVQASR